MDKAELQRVYTWFCQDVEHQSGGLGASLPELKSQLYLLLVVWPWAGSYASVSSSVKGDKNIPYFIQFW